MMHKPYYTGEIKEETKKNSNNNNMIVKCSSKCFYFQKIIKIKYDTEI